MDLLPIPDFQPRDDLRHRADAVPGNDGAKVLPQISGIFLRPLVPRHHVIGFAGFLAPIDAMVAVVLVPTRQLVKQIGIVCRVFVGR